MILGGTSFNYRNLNRQCHTGWNEMVLRPDQSTVLYCTLDENAAEGARLLLEAGGLYSINSDYDGSEGPSESRAWRMLNPNVQNRFFTP